MTELPTYTASRYLQPLREGGSLPAIVDTDGGGRWVVKFRGAGQGARALIAELLVGMIALELGLPVPELALIDVPPPFGRGEPDPEIQELLQRSHGVNVGLRYLDGAFNFDARAAGELVTPRLAAAVVWLDALTTNPDRTHRNPNLMVWERRPWLIDHGAALYAHHDWKSVDDARTRTPFPLIARHVLLREAQGLDEADARLAERLGGGALERIVGQLPAGLLLDDVGGAQFASAEEARERYHRYLATRLEAPRPFVAEALRQREALLREPPRALSARR